MAVLEPPASEVGKADMEVEGGNVLCVPLELVSKWREPPPPGVKEEYFHRFLRCIYFPLLVRFRGRLLLGWLVIFGISAAFGPSFLNKTRSDLDVPKGSESAKAIEAFTQYYGSGNIPPAFVVFHSASGSVLCNQTATASSQIQTFATGRSAIAGVSGFYELSQHPDYAALAQQSLSDDGKTMLATVSWNTDASNHDLETTIDDLITFTNGLSGSQVSVALTGLLVLFRQMSKQTEVNFLLIDAIVIPIAIVILGLRLQSYRHMAIAFMNLVCALLLAFAILVPVTDKYNINPFAPSIMMSLGVAVCFDYSLFMLTRMREERTVHFRSKEDAVFEMVAAAGHVVLLSGSTLLSTFILLFFFPQNFLQSVAWSCSAVVTTSILVNINMTPCWLLLCDCFSFFEACPSIRSCCCKVPAEDPAITARREALALAEAQEPRDSERRTVVATHGIVIWLKDMEARGWLFRLTWASTGTYSKWVNLLLALLIAVPFLIKVIGLQPTSDDSLLYLQESSSLNALKLMRMSFNEGMLDAYQLVCVTERPGAVLTPEYFAAENRLIQRLLSEQSDYMNEQSVVALSFFQGKDVNFTQGVSFLDTRSLVYNTPQARAYRVLVASKMNSNQQASLVTIQTTKPPNGQVMIGFIKGVRNMIGNYKGFIGPTSSLSISMYLFGGYTTTMDVQDTLYKLVPIEVAVILLIVLIILGVSFGSVFLSCRLLFTIAYSLVLTYGFMCIVYNPGPDQDNFAKISPWLTSSSGIYWIIPIMSFSILVGFALDYDIFLICRFVEFRMLGWSDRASICLAVEKTGGIITAAGLIMVASFMGLLFPKVIVLNQYGMSLFIGVALDTFVMRVFIVPPLIAASASCGECTNWWPWKPPTVKLSYQEELVALRRGLWVPCLEKYEVEHVMST